MTTPQPKPAESNQEPSAEPADALQNALPIVVEHLSFSYNGALVLQDIDFVLRRGVSLGLIGPNGGGKTTLLKLILGQLKPSSGTIRVFGRPPAKLGKLRAKIGYVPQKALFDPAFPATALDVVLMGSYFEAGLFSRVGSERRSRALALMTRLGVAALANEQIGKLSYGQQQRVFIARGLMSSPELLILDEPTTGIDTEGQNRFFRQLDELKHDLNLTVLMVSHNIARLADHVDEIACLYRTIHWHDRSELVNQQVLEKVYACELDAFFQRHRQHITEFHTQQKK